MLVERFRAKWSPVRVKKTRQIKNLEPRFDSIETEKALIVKFQICAESISKMSRGIALRYDEIFARSRNPFTAV